MTAVDMTHRLGMLPDEAVVRGSRLTEPARPASHAWKIVCRDPGLAVADQIARLLERLEPRIHLIADLAEELARSGDGACTLQVVRYLENLSGQHELLGWHLGSEVLDFLRRVRAELDVDEYG